jgi:serine protease Do
MRLCSAVLGLGLLASLATPGFARQEDRIFDLRFGGGGFLGVRIRDVSKDDVSAFKLPAERGVIVRDVESDGPGGKAGLREEDVIVRFQGHEVESASQFQRLVRETPPGRAVSLDVIRRGSSQTLTATVGGGEGFEGFRFGGPGDPPFPPPVPPVVSPRAWAPFESSGTTPRKLGIRFEEISGQLARYFKVDAERGILIVDVDAEGPAGRAGLKAGDVVLKLDGKSIGSSHDLVQTVRRLDEGSKVEVTVMRDGKPLDLAVTLGGSKEHHAPSGPTT